jgi:amino acid transporter
MFVSLGSIIGSGWLLSALSASETAGPAAILSWILAAGMLTVLALVYAELGATYPVCGAAAGSRTSPMARWLGSSPAGRPGYRRS